MRAVGKSQVWRALAIGCIIVSATFASLLLITLFAMLWTTHYGDLVRFIVLFLTSPFNLYEFVGAKVGLPVTIFDVILTTVDLLCAIALVGIRFGKSNHVIRNMLFTFFIIIVANYLSFAVHYLIWGTPLIGISGIAVDSSIIILMLGLEPILVTRFSPFRGMNNKHLALRLTAMSFAVVTLFMAFTSTYRLNHVIDAATMLLLVILVSMTYVKKFNRSVRSRSG